jgi:6-pyruvoyltetrahydropterin/6-carboxytetrahydropterin synthase
MSHAYTVTVAKEYLTFSAAHFITIAGHQCERLHGHNYRVGVTAAGAVDMDTGFVVDFGEVKEIVRPLITALDHRVLLPTRNPKVRHRDEGELLLVEYRGAHRFTFPRSHVALVPVTDTTAELLAGYLADQVAAAFTARGAAGLREIVVEVEESVGQSASCRVGLGQE